MAQKYGARTEGLRMYHATSLLTTSDGRNQGQAEDPRALER